MSENNIELNVAINEFYDSPEGSQEEHQAFIKMLGCANDLEDLELIFERGINSNSLTVNRPHLTMLLEKVDAMEIPPSS